MFMGSGSAAGSYEHGGIPTNEKATALDESAVAFVGDEWPGAAKKKPKERDCELANTADSLRIITVLVFGLLPRAP